MSTPVPDSRKLNRRNFLRTAAAATLAPAALAQQAGLPNQNDKITLPELHNPATEQSDPVPSPSENRDRRTGFAIVGLGDLSLKEILPAFGHSKYCKVTALVSGDRTKAIKLADEYGVKPSSVYDYTTYDQLAGNPDVQVIYIVLPNSMHADFTIRGARAGKHILCEKPMSTSVRDCQRMIDACNKANVKLMIAYRSQYEPNDLALIKMIRAGKLGKLRQFLSTNSQNQGDPNQWRQKLALAGGGCMPDVGVYCLNASRFLSGEEPYEVHATTYQPKDDPRFAEVEASCQVIARFPSGFTAIFNSSYDSHKSQWLRIEGSEAYAELAPAYAYHGIKLRYSKLDEDKKETIYEPQIQEKDQFAAEMDHFALCVQQNLKPHTPGEEGLQDQRITDAIYESARTGKPVKLTPPPTPTRGSDPQAD